MNWVSENPSGLVPEISFSSLWSEFYPCIREKTYGEDPFDALFSLVVGYFQRHPSRFEFPAHHILLMELSSVSHRSKDFIRITSLVLW